MNTMYQGKAFVFGDNLDTDQIYPGQYLELARAEDIKKHAMEGADPTFVKEVQPGDIVVAGTNFGCGSSREHAAITLKEAGVGVILAESFARIFYRNCINLGMPLLVGQGVKDLAQKGDKLKIDIEQGKVYNLTTGREIRVEPLKGYVLEILECGGIKPLVRRQLAGAGG